MSAPDEHLRVVGKAAWDEKRAEQTYLPARPAPNLAYGPPEWFQRIGSVMPEGHGGTWVLNAGDPPRPLADEVIEAIRRYALPAIEFERARVG